MAPETAIAMLRQAAGSGANHIETAWIYGAGACNAFIREALAPYPENLVVATKLGADVTADVRLGPDVVARLDALAG
ncbi:aldo/keto reductase [Spirillospora sp. NPDC052269]